MGEGGRGVGRSSSFVLSEREMPNLSTGGRGGRKWVSGKEIKREERKKSNRVGFCLIEGN